MTSNKDSLGDRIKDYENCYRFYIPKKSFVVIRLDGVAWHTWTRGLDKPFDKALIDDMDATTKFLCEKISGCKLGYVQSDEISLILSDCDSIDTEPWFGNNLQKLCSVSSAMCTAKFNQLRIIRTLENGACGRDMYELREFLVDDKGIENIKLAYFDARVFVLPTEAEVYNYLQWRSNDASRNSVSSVAQSLYSHKELHGKKTPEMHEMIFQKGINWNDYSYREKRGGTFARRLPLVDDMVTNVVYRAKWQPVETPIKWFDNKNKFPI